jgi:hypothetical protein
MTGFRVFQKRLITASLMMGLAFCISSAAMAQDNTEMPEATAELLDIPPSATPTMTIAPGTPIPTPTPTPSISPVVITWGEEMFYPQAIHFHIDFALPLSQLRVLTLVIEVENQPTRAIPMAELIRSAISDEQSTQIRYFWHIPSADLLPFLSEVIYHWEVTTAAGESIVVPGVVSYADPDNDWVQDSNLNDPLSFVYPQNGININPLRDGLNSVYALLAENTGNSPQFRLALYSDAHPLERCHDGDAGGLVVTGNYGTELACREPVINTLIASTGYTPHPVQSNGGFVLAQELTRHMVEVFYAPVWGGQDIPAWFKTGLAYVYFPGDKVYLLETLRIATRHQEQFSLEEMNAPPEPAMNRALWEAQSYGMVAYMIDQMGLAQVFQFASQVGVDTEFSESYAVAMEQPIEALLAQWNNWIFSGASVIGFELRLYAGPTPIPTHTPHATRFPASPTPTPTYTSTPTPTPTVTLTPTPTGVLTSTPLPSLTPSLTPETGPPTLTPRPPTYLTVQPTLTPVPAGPRDFTDLNRSQIAVIAIIIGGIFAMLFIVFDQARRKR